MRNYTKGPWYVETDGDVYKSVYICAPHYEGRICTMEVPLGTGKRSVKWNAKLIAAAPELLKMCEEIANDSGCNLVDSERRIKLYNLIARAGGGV